MTDHKYIPGYDADLQPDIAWWSAQIEQGSEFRDRWTMNDRWNTWDKYYRNDYPNPGSRLGLSDIMPVNLFYMMARSFVPRVYFRNPSLSIQAAKPGPEHLGLAMLMERIDNRLIIEMKIKRAMKKIINSAFFHGTGIGKLGFGAQYHPVGYTDDRAAPSQSKEGFEAEYRSDIVSDMPWFGHVQTDHLIVPAGTVDYLDAPWTAHAIYRPTEDMRFDPRLANTETLGSTHEAEHVKAPQELTLSYEVHDKRTGLAFTFSPSASSAAEGATVLISPRADLQQSANGGPMYPIVFNDNLDVFWGLPDGAILEPLQDEINEIATQIMYHRRLSIVKFIADKGAIDEQWAKAFLTDG